MGKKKTLPKNFEELLKENNIEKIKKELDKCEPNAYSGYCKYNALAFPEITEEIAKYLIERGADINYRDSHKNIPLHHHARASNGNIDLLIELGSDVNAVNIYGETPIYKAASSFQADNVEKLLKYNADIKTKNDNGYIRYTILENVLISCFNINIAKALKISELLLNAGFKIENKEKIKEYVTKIGKNFESNRKNIDKNLINDLDNALTKLYNLFDVEPVPRKKVYDGVSLIIPTSEKWQDIYKELWDLLVPSSGKADILQGEVIRISGKMSYEILDNGCINWDKDYKLMLDEFIKYLSSYNTLEEIEDLKQLAKLIEDKKELCSEKEINKLSMYAVKWVLLNPNPIKCETVKYNR